MEAVQERQRQPVKTPLRLVPERPPLESATRNLIELFPGINRMEIQKALMIIKGYRDAHMSIHPSWKPRDMIWRINNDRKLRKLFVMTDLATEVWHKEGKDHIISPQNFIMIIKLEESKQRDREGSNGVPHIEWYATADKKAVKKSIGELFNGRFPLNWRFVNKRGLHSLVF